MRVAMIGAGYVGLVSGACFSEFGHTVTCVDSDKDKIAALNGGEIPIFEPGLADLVDANRKAGRLTFATELGEAVREAGAVFIAVGTPSRRGGGHADLSYVHAAAEEIVANLQPGAVVVTKSTVPVGTCREVERIIREHRPDLDFDVASNPEFLREGAAIDDFMRPNRVVVGTDSERARAVLRDLYRPLFLNETPVVFTTPESSELIKYASNAFLAAKITMINELADLCEVVGADVQDVARAVGLDRRIGPKFLHAGPGYGGSCFPKDTVALLRTAELVDVNLGVVEAVVSANERRKKRIAERVVEACDGDLGGKAVAVLGLSFKPNTDDMREAPSLDIIAALQGAGAAVKVFDPEAMTEARGLLDKVEFCADAYDAMNGAEAVVIVTEWNEFRALDLSRVGHLMKRKVMIDLRNIYDPGEMAAAGFEYFAVGRPARDRS